MILNTQGRKICIFLLLGRGLVERDMGKKYSLLKKKIEYLLTKLYIRPREEQYKEKHKELI
jgi:hypothetical protein